MLVYLLTLLSALYVTPVASVCPSETVKITSASGLDGILSLNNTQGASDADGLDCRWLLSNVQSCRNGSSIVSLEWVYLNTTDVKDMIIIYDGDSTRDARVLQQVSGSKLELSKNTSGSNALVNFLSDGHEASGFALRYRFLCGPYAPPVQNCRPLSSPFVLNLTYQNKIDFTDDQRNIYQDCAWVISNELPNCKDPYVEFEFSNFSALFPYDYLDLYDGTTTNHSSQIGRYQGTKVYYGPGYQRSTSKQVLVVFHNEYSHPGTEWTGFSATFRARCDAKPQPNCALRDEPMIINKTTPYNYMVYSPAHYRPNAACYWLFQNPNKTCERPVVLMIFPVFRTIELYDTVSLWNGPVPVTSNLIGKWSGFMPDAVPQGFIKSEGAEVLMEFHSGALYNDDNNRGFTVQFAFPCDEDLPKISEEACPKYLQAQPPPARAPGLLDFTASSYRNNLDCGWVWLNNRTDCPAGSQPVVQLEFLHFETEAKFDYVNIYDGPMSRRGGTLAYDDYYILGSYSGSKGWEIPTVVRSTQPSIMLTFHSDGTVSDANDDGNHNDGIKVQVSHVCSNDPVPKNVTYDCRADNGMPYARFWTPNVTLQNPRVTFEHLYLPFNLAYPVIIEQYFSDPVPMSMLSSRGAEGVEGEVVIGTDLVHPGENSTWRCCGELNTSRPVRGSILVCERGDCLFVQKVQTGQRYGAVGVIVVDTTETGVRMGSTIDVSDVTIPSVSTISSIGVMLLNATARAPVYARLASFTCPEGTYSPTATPLFFTNKPTPASPSSPPTLPPSTQPPRAPTPPTEALPSTTLYFTVPLETIRFTQDVRDRFMNNLNSFFLWVPGTATLSSFAPDPNDASSTVAEVVVDVDSAELALTRWGTASPPDKMVLSSPGVVSLSRHEPHKRCTPIDCESTSLRTAQWDPIKCSCSRFITGSGSFVMIILPIFLILLLILCLCCYCAPCPLYGRWKKKAGHQQVAMDDMHLQDVHMMPRDIKDSEESMRGEGQPYDTEDPPAEQRDWDEEDRRHGSALIRTSQAEPIRISRPRSDDSDEEDDGRTH